MDWYGFTYDEQHALEAAQTRGYLVNTQGFHFTLYEAWRLSCERTCRPMVLVGKCHEYRSVVLDTTTVFDDAITGAPSMMPTDRTRIRLERIAQRYVRADGEHSARLTPSYVFLPNVYPGSAERVARLVLQVWNEASFFASQERLWSVA